MTKKRLRVNAEVRKLLHELDELHEQYGEYTRQLCEDNLTEPEAIGIGSEREFLKVQISGCGWRLVKAARGEV